MDSSAPKHGQVRADPPGFAEPAAPAAAEPPRQRRSSAAWRVVLFIWVTAFGFLVAYELITMVFRMLNIR